MACFKIIVGKLAVNESQLYHVVYRCRIFKRVAGAEEPLNQRSALYENTIDIDFMDNVARRLISCTSG